MEVVAPAGAPAARFSIKQQFAGAHVLLTGCTGYIGGLVLESMLRTTDVARVYVLLRGKKSQSSQERCDKVLQGPVFHLVRDRPELLAKVTAVAGDLSEPGLGLSAHDFATLAENVEVLIHSAADIRLEAPIQETLRANYVGTERILQLALQLRRLRSMVHVSTCYVNINKPRGATVHERIYPLNNGEVEVDGETVANELLSMAKVDADRRADFYTHHWGFPNTYCLGKHLAEQMVYRTQKATGLPIAILRPSLVTGVAGLPWPGYCGNWAGPSGMGAAVAIGFFPSLYAHAVDPYSVWDAVPGDLVASAILATAAAVAAGLQREIAAATGCGAWAGGAGEPAALALARAAGSVTAALPASLSALAGKRAPSLGAFSDDSAISLIAAGAPRAGAGSASCSDGSRSPLSGVSEEEPEADEGSAPATPARALSPKAGAGGAAGAGAGAAGAPLLIVQAATSTTYPSGVYEAYNTTVDFLRTHGAPSSILIGGAKALPYMPPSWSTPSLRAVRFWRVYTGIKVAIVCFLLRLFGLSKAAQKLSVGYQQWAMNNDFKNDTQLLFASAALQQLHARIEPSERRDYLLTFGPILPAVEAEGAEPEHAAAHLGWRQYSINCLAGILRMLTGRLVPESAEIAGRPGEFIHHQYLHIR
ncbi:hypothetical protein Rsub_10397 [Raphidocelis subcapitata]|uniref:Fatty acyl-CoA reductase n=1 Tax=Raphidocelis subcapitata TaxID=307507 RepID=A0A2V0PC98_9CHLO|nr:hypothetical protein Rsub_10397 [Raphidocelis subcapitata]|eukprot:GBF97474.1 hypothetical protein Rsub_10397 [Raphidocelis subcapitata]